MVTDFTEYIVNMLYNFCEKTMRCTRTFGSLSEAKKFASDLRCKYNPEHISIVVSVRGSIEDF